MNIFVNLDISNETIDFTKWETINGDYLNLENARIEDVEKCLEQLYYYMEQYPAHVNYPVWKKYAITIENILALRI